MNHKLIRHVLRKTNFRCLSPFYPFALNPICFVYIYESTNEAQTQIHRGASTPAAYCAAQPPFDCAVSFCVIVASAAPEPARSGISVAVVAAG